MKRRKVLTWVDTTPYHCPECDHVFEKPRVVVDNHAAPQLETSEEILAIGGHLISCPQCNKKHLLQIEMTGSFFTGFGAGVKPKLTLFRVLPGYQGLEVEQERDLVMPGGEEGRRMSDVGRREEDVGHRMSDVGKKEEEERPPDVEAVQSWGLMERVTELLEVKKEIGGIEEFRD